MHALLLALVLTQTIYEWTDAKGVTHYTDNPSSIPAGVKPRTTSGGAVTVLPAGPQDEAVPATPARQPKRCDETQKLVVELEKKLADAKTQAAAREKAEAQRCQELLNVHGQAAFSQCMANLRVPTGDVEAGLARDLDAAREAHRRQQAAGCR